MIISKQIEQLIEDLMQHAQNEEMVDQYYTEHGLDCLQAAQLLKDIKRLLE